MRSVAWFSHDQHNKNKFFLVCDPAGKYRIYGFMGNVFKHRDTKVLTVILFVILATFLVVIFLSMERIEDVTESDSVILLFFLGFLGGFIAISITALMEMANRTASPDNYFKVTTENQRAWRLCLTVATLGRVASWVDGTVDTARQAPSILWSAVGRSITLDQQDADATQALEPSSLEEFESLSPEDLAKERLSEIGQERQSLNAVEANLNQVLKTAISIDRQRVRIAEEKRFAKRLRRKARKLRDRLAGYNTTAAPQLSDTQADRTAGLAAETKFIADLLAECDRMLRESDRLDRATRHHRPRRHAPSAPRRRGTVKLIYALVGMANVTLWVGVFIYIRISPDMADKSLPPFDAVLVSALPPRPPDAAPDRILPQVISTTTGEHVFLRITPDSRP